MLQNIYKRLLNPYNLYKLFSVQFSQNDMVPPLSGLIKYKIKCRLVLLDFLSLLNITVREIIYSLVKKSLIDLIPMSAT